MWKLASSSCSLYSSPCFLFHTCAVQEFLEARAFTRLGENNIRLPNHSTFEISLTKIREKSKSKNSVLSLKEWESYLEAGGRWPLNLMRDTWGARFCFFAPGAGFLLFLHLVRLTVWTLHTQEKNTTNSNRSPPIFNPSVSFDIGCIHLTLRIVIAMKCIAYSMIIKLGNYVESASVHIAVPS